ncbi:MAG: hypothetical protein KDC05_16385 [Bacteroidales bacterium]|nr:hypothetical protein [Bacteroidales bacterium]
MFTVITSEIRWFIPGNVPEMVAAWFDAQGGNMISEPDRTDTYLVLPKTNNVGIKVRQGRVEIKKLIRNFGETKISTNLSGYREMWQKWSFDVDPAGNLPLSFNLGTSQWSGISKKRKLFRFAIEINKLIPLQSESPFPENGAHIELAEISINSNNWWTFGVEAFGHENQLENHLQLMLDQGIKHPEFDVFLKKTSMSYPGWLSKLPG